MAKRKVKGRANVRQAVYISLSAAAAARREVERQAKRIMKKYNISAKEGQKIAKKMGSLVDRQTLKLRKRAAKIAAEQADKAFKSARATLKELEKVVKKLEKKARS